MGKKIYLTEDSLKDIIRKVLNEIALISEYEGEESDNTSVIEAWSRKERKKRAKNCSNPRGFTMKQFCKNQRTRSKRGEKKN